MTSLIILKGPHQPTMKHFTEVTVFLSFSRVILTAGLHLIKRKLHCRKSNHAGYFLNLSEIQNIVTRGQVDMCLFKKEKAVLHSWKPKVLEWAVFTIQFSFLLKLYAKRWLESGILMHLLPSIIQSLGIKLRRVASFPQNHKCFGCSAAVELLVSSFVNSHFY